MALSNNPHLKKLTRDEIFKKVADICNAVAVTLSGKELLEISLKKTMDLFAAKRGSIFILNPDGKELILKIAHGMKTDEQEKMVKRLGEGFVGKVAETKKPLVVANISTDARFKGYKSSGQYSTPSFICAPLMIKDTLIGVINIADKESGKRFSRQELQLLDFVSTQIALNYRRTQLYEKFKSVVQESESLKKELGKKSEVTDRLKEQVAIHEKLASIGKLTAGIAHELNNPLDGVLRYVNLSLEHTDEEEQDVVYGYLLEAKQGLNRMVNIIKSLLACSRNALPTLKKVDLNETIKETIGSLRSEFYHKNIKVEKIFGENLPEIMDYGIERITSNLLRNAIDAVDDGGKITVATDLSDGCLLLKVSDSGCGMPREALSKIYEPFYTTKDIDKGCGLGLTIVNEIVKTWRGTIVVESRPTRGTTFTVKLPLSVKNGERINQI